MNDVEALIDRIIGVVTDYAGRADTTLDLCQAIGAVLRTHGAHEAHGQVHGSSAPEASVSKTCTNSSSVARPRAREDADPSAMQAEPSIGPGELVDRPPDELAEILPLLPRWQARYALNLLELGGNIGLAAVRTRVSRQSVETAMKENSTFAEACAIACGSAKDLEEAALFLSATVGTLQPVYQQGRLVGYARIRDTRAAEKLLMNAVY